MTIDQWIAVAASAGTVVATLIATVSIYEIRRQNKRQYLPRITIADSKYEVLLKDNMNCWKSGIDEEAGEKSQPALPILNVGNGVATHLRLRWIYDSRSLLNDCNVALNKTDFQIRKNYKSKVLCLVKRGNEKGPIVGVLDSSNISLDYISPVTIQPKGRDIRVDFTLQALSAILLRELHGNHKEDVFSRTERDIKLSIEYFNNLGDRFREVIIIKLRVIAIQKMAGEDFSRATSILERVSSPRAWSGWTPWRRS